MLPSGQMTTLEAAALGSPGVGLWGSSRRVDPPQARHRTAVRTKGTKTWSKNRDALWPFMTQRAWKLVIERSMDSFKRRRQGLIPDVRRDNSGMCTTIGSSSGTEEER